MYPFPLIEAKLDLVANKNEAQICQVWYKARPCLFTLLSCSAYEHLKFWSWTLKLSWPKRYSEAINYWYCLWISWISDISKTKFQLPVLTMFTNFEDKPHGSQVSVSLDTFLCNIYNIIALNKRVSRQIFFYSKKPVHLYYLGICSSFLYQGVCPTYMYPGQIQEYEDTHDAQHIKKWPLCNLRTKQALISLRICHKFHKGPFPALCITFFWLNCTCPEQISIGMGRSAVRYFIIKVFLMMMLDMG